MSFLLECPRCGLRDVNEFGYAGEVSTRPRERPTLRELSRYVYFRANVAGVQTEWWRHRLGCELWFQAERDTRTNEVPRTWVPEVAAGAVPVTSRELVSALRAAGLRRPKPQSRP